MNVNALKPSECEHIQTERVTDSQKVKNKDFLSISKSRQLFTETVSIGDVIFQLLQSQTINIFTCDLHI